MKKSIAVVIVSLFFVSNAQATTYQNQNNQNQYQNRYQNNNQQVVRAPSNLRANATPNGVQLSWNDNSSNESSFWIRRTSSVYGDTDGDGDFIANVQPNTTYFVDRTARPGRTYYYRVRVASRTGFPSDRNYTIWSNQISVTAR